MAKRRNYFINKKFQLKYTFSIVVILAVVMITAGAGVYFGMWGSIIENFSSFKVSQNLETAKRIADYEDARYRKGDYRLNRIFREAELLSVQQQDALKNALEAVNRSLLPKVIVLSLAIFLAGIIISHKVAGPMYRIERSAEAISRGDLSVNFRTRKGDELKSTSSALGNMVAFLHEDFVKLKTADKVLDERIRDIEPRINKEDALRLRDAVKVIDGVLAKYKT